MKKYLITQECDYVYGYLRSGHLEGEVYANSSEEALEKWKNAKVYYDVIADDYRVESYEVSDDNEIIVTLLEENDEWLGY